MSAKQHSRPFKLHKEPYDKGDNKPEECCACGRKTDKLYVDLRFKSDPTMYDGPHWHCDLCHLAPIADLCFFNQFGDWLLLLMQNQVTLLWRILDSDIVSSANQQTRSAGQED